TRARFGNFANFALGKIDDVQCQDLGTTQVVNPTSVGVVGTSGVRSCSGAIGELHKAAGFDFGAEQLNGANSIGDKNEKTIIGGEVGEVEVKIIAGAICG